MAVVAAVLTCLPILADASSQTGFATHPPLPGGYRSIKVFDSQGRFVGRILSDKRYWATIDRIPIFLQNAVVAVEDARFYDHGGIDIRGIARAMVKNVVKRRMAEGGSTITQQLIKNRYLTSEKTLDRKLKEAQMAIEFERTYTKKQILEMYFNEIYFGNGAWGIAQAARVYFDKYPEQLSEAECAMLAGVPKNPGRYNPLGKPALVAQRRDVVLKRMLDLGVINQRSYRKLRSQSVTVVQHNQAPYYLAHIRNRLVESHGAAIIDLGGLEVTAAMHLDLQKAAEKALSEGVRKLSPGLQGALLCLDPVNGDVLAAVGGVDYAKSPYNRAFSAKRQPGSAIKPMIYAAALEYGFTAASIISDMPVAYSRGNGQMWKPMNYGHEQHGDLTLRKALAYSSNVVTVKLLDRIGVGEFVDYASRFGLSLRKPNDLSLALGSEELTLSELVTAYAPLANGGQLPKARTVLRIYDHNRQAWSETAPVATPSLSPATAYVTTAMLRDVMAYGTAKSLRKFSQTRPMAGKTGTTDDYRDAWFVGYTPRMVTGVWLGHDKPQPGGRGFTGGAAAAPIWGRFMQQVLKGRPVDDFQKPDNVVSVTIDPTTGKLAAPECPVKREELFVGGTEPAEYCPKHGKQEVKPAAQPAPSSLPELEKELSDAALEGALKPDKQ
ncbi:MAG TPA: PBP1A family penicillin-binding protein [Deltaproteobacteria bacterium]|nr:PBP1A family penicillin-binding protein [Deltaproteobacteria bacterium]HQB39237.1 PBP1A family penicillin-binding protein [Deltaproteobacteria bacterium]